MLELDKSGKFWWLDGSVIEPYQITERWEEMVNALESMGDKLETIHTELAETAFFKGRVAEAVALLLVKPTKTSVHWDAKVEKFLSTFLDQGQVMATTDYELECKCGMDIQYCPIHGPMATPAQPNDKECSCFDGGGR